MRDGLDFSPLGQAEHEVAAGAFSKAGDTEPAGLAVVLGTGVAGDGVADDVAPATGLLQLRGVGEVANDGDLGDGARRRGAEGAGGSGRGEGGAAGDERRHGVRMDEALGCCDGSSGAW
jgi:hypothetical protein